MAALQEYKCPCCGGAVEFNAQLQKMKCPYCDTEFEPEALATRDAELDSMQDEDMTWEQSGAQWEEGEADSMRSYICKSCGGQIVGDENTAATSCPFCGNPVVMLSRFSGMQKPDCIIPFKLDKNAALEALKGHYKGKRLLPRVFKDQNHLQEIRGIYVPVWLFDACAVTTARFKATKVKTWSDSRYDYTKTDYFDVVRGGSIAFERIPVDGSTKMDDALMESIEPFDASQAVDFSTAYLAGYLADKYDVDAQQSMPRANERIRQSAQEAFASTVTDYSSVEVERCSVRLREAKNRYALYPVWILNTKWKDETYTFAMNGQTGKFVGDLPLDKGAYRRWLFGLWIILAAVLFAVVGTSDIMMRAGIALGVGLIVSLITTSIMRGNLKSVHSKNQANDYVKQGSMQLQTKRDTFLYSRVDKREKEKKD